MKKYSSLVRISCLLIASFYFSGCSKLRDYIIQHPTEISNHCKIESIAINAAGSGTEGGTMHFQFIYNSAGDPQEMQILDVMYAPDLHFRYDKKGRLSDVLQTDLGQSLVYVWSRYSYPSARVIIDSVYQYQGNVNDPNPPNTPGTTIRIVRMQLDELGRPVKFQEHYSDPNIPSSSSETVYDRNGNMVLSGAIYDNKINIYQTSKTWQLYYLDYSRNNRTGPPNAGPTTLPPTPNAYNTYGLPTKFLGPSWPIFGYSFNTMDVAYACDVPEGPSGY
jgi:hypothetical protein